jgi:hypothetical protein
MVFWPILAQIVTVNQCSPHLVQAGPLMDLELSEICRVGGGEGGGHCAPFSVRQPETWEPEGSPRQSHKIIIQGTFLRIFSPEEGLEYLPLPYPVYFFPFLIGTRRLTEVVFILEYLMATGIVYSQALILKRFYFRNEIDSSHESIPPVVYK